ncbi:putative sensory transduction regulator [Ornithinibacter aureus]|nr:putative sensory transduction regulator [Ornithinibacter aureus]
MSRYGGPMTDPTSLPNFPPPADEHPLRGRVLDILVDLGLAPNLDTDGDVAFTVNEQQLFIRCTEGEVEIMRVFGQWQIQEEMLGDRLKLHETCNELNLNMNCLKSGVAGSTLVVTSEHLATPGADVSSLIQVSIQVILSGVHIWHQRLLGIDPNAPETDAGSPS